MRRTTRPQETPLRFLKLPLWLASIRITVPVPRCKSINGAIERPLVVDNPYRAQIVTQAQTVRVFDGPATAHLLRHAAQRMRRFKPWQAQLQTLQLVDEITVSELSDRTGIPRRMLHDALRGAEDLPTRLEKRQVQLRVPARTVRRTFGTVGAYPTRAFLRAIAEDGMVLVSDQRHKTSLGRVRTTREIANTLTTGDGHLNHSVPVARPLQLPEADLPIPPYTLGAWLGDGGSWQAVITSADPEIIENIVADGYRVRAYNLASDATKGCRDTESTDYGAIWCSWASSKCPRVRVQPSAFRRPT